jgi:hypothetical protein
MLTPAKIKALIISQGTNTLSFGEGRGEVNINKLPRLPFRSKRINY